MCAMDASPIPSDKTAMWQAVCDQIYQIIHSDTAIIDRYGMVLASRIPEFVKGKLISPMVWNLFTNISTLKKELGVQTIGSWVVETEIGNIVFTFGKFLHLMSKVPPTVNLAEYLPNVNRFLQTLDKSTDPVIDVDIQLMDFQREFSSLERKESKDKIDNFPIFKSLIKSIAKGK
jgi:hypothetical protein